MSLDQEIKDRRAEIRSDGYPMSIGELISLSTKPMKNWTYILNFSGFSGGVMSKNPGSSSPFCLGIPLPSIFVSQREDGVWDVIDGLQRLSTIFRVGWHSQERQTARYVTTT